MLLQGVDRIKTRYVICFERAEQCRTTSGFLLARRSDSQQRARDGTNAFLYKVISQIIIWYNEKRARPLSGNINFWRIWNKRKKSLFLLNNYLRAKLQAFICINSFERAIINFKIICVPKLIRTKITNQIRYSRLTLNEHNINYSYISIYKYQLTRSYQVIIRTSCFSQVKPKQRKIIKKTRCKNRFTFASRATCSQDSP